MIGCSENWRGIKALSECTRPRAQQLASFVHAEISRIFRLFAKRQPPLRRSGAMARRFSQRHIHCANVNWNCYSVSGPPKLQTSSPRKMARKKTISGDSCISWFKAFPSSIFHPPSFMLPSCISGRSPSSASACSAVPSGWPSDAGNSRARPRVSSAVAPA